MRLAAIACLLVAALVLSIATLAMQSAQDAREASLQYRESLRACEVGLHRADAKLEMVEKFLEVARPGGRGGQR